MQEATVIAERIRVLIADWVEAATGIHVTVSVGVTCLSAADESIGNVIARADAALYEAKADGRNRVRSRPPGLYEVPQPTPPPQLAAAV
jgi:diguanylate cyclase (GGDEF)-like protein